MRVFVTGVGMVSPLGVGAENNWAKLLKGETNIQKIPSHWSNYLDFSSQVYSPLPTIEFKEYGFNRTEILQRDKVSLLSNLATIEAIQSAGLDLKQIDKKTNQHQIVGIDSNKTGVVYGTGGGGADSYIANTAHQKIAKVKTSLEALLGKDHEILELLWSPKRYNPFTLSRVLCHSVAASNALKFGINGVVRTITQACSSGTTAIGVGAELIKSGQSDLVITGGAENCDDYYGCGFYSFDVTGALVKTDQDANLQTINRPFDKDRNGFLFSPGGAGSLILESEEHLTKRGGTALAELVGFAETFDAYSIMAPEPSGKKIKDMMMTALQNAELDPSQVNYINAHGTSTPANDQIEADTIMDVFGRSVAVNSTKSIVGHTTGASGAIEAIAAVFSLRDQELHPSLNIENPIADLDFVTERRQQKVDYALSHSFAFGGHNSGIILAKP